MRPTNWSRNRDPSCFCYTTAGLGQNMRFHCACHAFLHLPQPSTVRFCFRGGFFLRRVPQFKLNISPSYSDRNLNIPNQTNENCQSLAVRKQSAGNFLVLAARCVGAPPVGRGSSTLASIPQHPELTLKQTSDIYFFYTMYSTYTYTYIYIYM